MDIVSAFTIFSIYLANVTKLCLSQALVCLHFCLLKKIMSVILRPRRHNYVILACTYELHETSLLMSEFSCICAVNV